MFKINLNDNIFERQLLTNLALNATIHRYMTLFLMLSPAHKSTLHLTMTGVKHAIALKGGVEVKNTDSNVNGTVEIDPRKRGFQQEWFESNLVAPKMIWHLNFTFKYQPL